MRNPYTAHLALFGTNLFFAFNFSAVKHLLNAGLMQPFGLNLVRAGITTALLWLLFFFKPVKTKIDPKDIWRFIACGLTGIAINQLLFLKGLSLTYSTHAALLMLATPILIVIMAAWVLKEAFSIQKAGGLLLGLTGATLLIVSGTRSGTGSNVLWGDLLVLLNALSYALYFILVKPLMLKYNNVMIIRMVFTIGTLVILPFGWQEFQQIPWASYSGRDFIYLFMIVICGTFLAYLFNIYGIRTLGASIAGSYIYIQPFLAALIAMLMLNERLSLFEIFAGCLIIAGVLVINMKRKIINSPKAM